MQINLMQGIMLSILAFIAAWDKRWESFFLFRPISVGFFAGIILGDVRTGLTAGAIAELSYLGLLTIGGTVPPDPLMAGLMTVVIAIRSGVNAETALGLSLPFALLMQWFIIAEQSIAALINAQIENALRNNDLKRFKRLVFVPDTVMTLGYAVITFLATYVMQDAISSFVQSFPGWLTSGFELAGGLLPAVGLGLLLTVMANRENWPFLVIGFIAMTVLNVENVLPIALVAAAVAYLICLNDKKQDELEEKMQNAEFGGSENDGI